MAFPVPVIDISVEPRTKEAVEKMTLGLQKLAGEDPSLRLRTDQETGQTILSGMGELHLEIIIDRLRREYGVDCNIGAPQVAYRETISKPHTETYTHKKQSGGSGQYAEVKIIFEPLERNTGVVFENKVVGGSVPKEYIPAVEKGIKVQADTGVLAGFPTVDFKYTLVDGKYHDVDSSALAFEIAAKACFREGMKSASPIILEPIMDVEVTTPQDHVGDVVGDLNRRRGHDPEPGKLRLDRDRAGACAAEGDVRLHLPPAQHDEGPRVLHHAVPPLRSGAAQRGGRDHEKERLIPARYERWQSTSGANRGIGSAPRFGLCSGPARHHQPVCRRTQSSAGTARPAP